MAAPKSSAEHKSFPFLADRQALTCHFRTAFGERHLQQRLPPKEWQSMSFS